MARNSGIRKIVVTGALGAVTVALSLTQLGYIPWVSGASLSVLHIPALVGALIEGPVVGVLVGGIFGVTSLVQAAINPAKGPIDLFFLNPLVSVLPRLLYALPAWLLYKAFRGRLTGLGAGAAGLVGSLVHSLLVLGALVIGGAIPFAVAGAVFVANSLVEAAAAALLTAAIVGAWKGVEGRGGKARLAGEGE